MNTKTESKLVSLVTELLSPRDYAVSGSVWDLIRKQNAFQIICLFRLMELNFQPMPESEFMSLVTQMIRLYRSIDLASHPDTLSKLIKYISRNENIPPYASLVRPTLELESEPELISLIYQLFSLVISMNSSKWEKLVSLCPQVQVTFKEKEKFRRVKKHTEELLLELVFDGMILDHLPVGFRAKTFVGMTGRS